MSAFSSILAAAVASALAGATSQPASSPAPVTLVEMDGMVELANGCISLVIDKANGQITSLHLAGGPDVLRRPGRTVYFDSNALGPAPEQKRAGYRGSGRRDYRLIRRSDDLVDVGFRSQPGEQFPFETDLHYVLRAGDSGVYAYIVYRHPPSAAPSTLIQTRIVMKLRGELFTHYFVNDQTTGQFPALRDPSDKLTPVTDATVMFPGGRIATKYNLADFEEDHHVHGVAGGEGGVWTISASNEYLNGGPTKQDLQVHEDSCIVLKMLHSGHFLMAGGLSFQSGEAWTKFYGPFLVYLNRADSPQAAWADAQERTRREEADWPYAWVQHEEFPLARGRVTGELTVEGEPAVDACVILTAGDGDWQVQGKGYQFWTRTGDDGTFALKNVRPGSYALHAFVPGFVGEAYHGNVSVEADRTTDLGQVNFHPLVSGRLLWQIGTPDRSAAEFRYGDLPRQFGLWNRYLADFPEDVTFRIGASRERADWNYCQPVVQRPDGSWHKPTWRIVFELPAAQTGQATLTIGVAGAARKPTMVLSVNDTEIARSELANDGSVYRDANQAGYYRLWTIPFDAARLRQGPNVLTLEMLKSDPSPPQPYDPLSLPRAAVMYDFLRLEVAP